MSKWEPVDVVAFTIAFAVCSILFSVIFSAVVLGHKLSPEGLDSFNKITHGLVGIVGVYVGSMLKR